MKNYIGTKIIEAEPCAAWKNFGNHKIGDPGYKVRYEDGYESWSPKDVFEKAYRPMDGLPFGLALEAMKKGHKVTRRGWNGKGQWVVYRTGYPDGIPCNKNTADAVGIPEGSLFKVRPYFQLKCVDDTFQMWFASVSDMLEEDWVILE